jgi:hypothetical protein
MSTEHHTHDDQGVIAGVPGGGAAGAGASSAHEQRWHDVLANFVDDPRGAVLAATELVVSDVSAFVAVLDQRRKNMLNAAPGDHAVSTEDLRQAASAYRAISKQLTASTQALGESPRGKPARDDQEAQRREVIGGRFDAAAAKQATPHHDTPAAQPSPEDQASQTQRDIAKWRSGKPSSR